MASLLTKMDVVPKRGRGVPEILAQSRRPLPVRGANLLGRDASGQVVATGVGIKDAGPRQSVPAPAHPVGYAAYGAVDARHCLPIPACIDMRDAAGVPEGMFTVCSDSLLAARLGAGERLRFHHRAATCGRGACRAHRQNSAGAGPVWDRHPMRSPTGFPGRRKDRFPRRLPARAG